MEHLILLGILIIPLSWPWLSKLIWPHNITLKEILLHLGIVFIITCSVYYLGMVGQSIDTEVWNGEVTSKAKNKVSCEHSYSCNCRTESCGKDCSTTVCDTCYEHFYDVDWDVYSNVESTTTINRVDRQGLSEPPRWTAVQIGEPYSDTKMFQNYIKGAPKSLFNNKDLITKYQNIIPEYPNNIYDYYHIDRVISIGVNIPNIQSWNKGLAEILKELGPKKESNVVIVIVKSNQVDYAKALKEAWLGGKKNDTVVIIGSINYPNIDFVNVFSWSNKAILEVELRDEILATKILNKDKILSIIRNQILKNFSRRSMEEFAYLADDVVPPTWLIVITAVISILVSAGISYWTYKEDIFSENIYSRR